MSKTNKIIVENKGEGIIILPAYNSLTDIQSRLVPGVNEVESATWNKVKGALEHHLKSGLLVVKFASEEKVKAGEGEKATNATVTVGKGFEDLSVEDQTALVKGCNDLKLLNQWSVLPSVFKSTVAPIINEQIKMVQTAGEEGKAVPGL